MSNSTRAQGTHKTRVIVRRSKGMTTILVEGWPAVLILGLAAAVYLAHLFGG
jgi:hypothetical protein